LERERGREERKTAGEDWGEGRERRKERGGRR